MNMLKPNRASEKCPSSVLTICQKPASDGKYGSHCLGQIPSRQPLYIMYPVWFPLWGSLALGVLDWSTAQESLVSVLCASCTISEVRYVSCLPYNLRRQGSIARRSWRLGAPEPPLSHCTSSD